MGGGDGQVFQTRVEGGVGDWEGGCGDCIGGAVVWEGGTGT